MAFTPQLVAGAWVGGEERYIHFNSGAIGQGASAALPIYGSFIKKVYNDKTLPYDQSARFTFPAIDLCEKEFYGESTDYDNDAEEASIEGVFD